MKPGSARVSRQVSSLPLKQSAGLKPQETGNPLPIAKNPTPAPQAKKSAPSGAPAVATKSSATPKLPAPKASHSDTSESKSGSIVPLTTDIKKETGTVGAATSRAFAGAVGAEQKKKKPTGMDAFNPPLLHLPIARAKPRKNVFVSSASTGKNEQESFNETVFD